MRRLLPLLVWLSLASAGSAAGLDPYLVSRWTFPNGSLQGERDGFPLAKAGLGAEQSAEGTDGWMRLGRGMLLFCGALGAEKIPDLAKAATLWVRFRLDAAPALDNAFLFGLSASDQPADWKQMVLAVLYRGGGGSPLLGPYGQLDDGHEMGVGPGRLLPVKAGDDLAAAISFDGPGQTLTFWVNGASVTKDLGGPGRLARFSGFGLGRLKASGSVPLSIREARVYSIALAPAWIDEVTARALEK